MHDEIKQTKTVPDIDDAPLKDMLADIPADTATGATTENIDDLRRWGFQYAIKDRQGNTITAEGLVWHYRNRVFDELKKWEAIYDSVKKRYNEKISELRTEIEGLEEKGETGDPTLQDLKRRKEEVVAEMKELRRRILEVRRRMATGKEDMMNKWMEDAEKQIEKAVSLQKKVYLETRLINQQRYDDGKITLDKHIAQLTIKRTNLQERQAEVHSRMKQIGADGVNPGAANLLIGIGTSVAAAAGYFFSIFTSNTGFGNNDAFFFLLSGLLKVGASSETSFLTKTGLLISFVLVIGLISFGCFKLLTYLFHRKGPSADDKFNIHARGKMARDNYDVAGELKAGSWFSLWLQIAPAVIIIGIVILLLAITDPQAGIQKLNSSIEGVLAGTSVALGIGGIMCLYIMKIIEPRLQKRQKEQGLVNWLKYNWELAGCMLLFMVFTLAIIFYPIDNGALSNHAANAIAIPEFIVVCMLSAFPFAYGVRFKGLIIIGRFLQNGIDRLDYIIAECSTPEIPGVTVDYSVKMQAMIDDVLTVVQNKAMLLRGITSTEELAPKKVKEEKNTTLGQSIIDFLTKKLKYFFGDRTKASPINQLTQLADWERRYFPDIDEEIKLLALEYMEYEQELEEIKTQLDKIDAEAIKDKDKNSEAAKKLRQRIETLLTYCEKAEAVKISRISKMELSSIKAEAAILDGFHLGVWYRRNQLGPVDDHYTDIEPFNNEPIKLIGNGDN